MPELALRRRKPRRRLGRSQAEQRFAGGILLPALLIMLIVVFVPLAYAFMLSLNKAEIVVVGGKGSVLTTWRGLRNYLYFLGDPSFWYSVRVTSYFTMVSLAVEMVIGTVFALVLNQEFRGRPVVRALLILPWAVPTVVNARLWGLIFEPHAYGALNGLLQTLHIIGPGEAINFLAPIPLAQSVPVLGRFTAWLGATQAINYIIVGDTWKVVPVVALLLLAGLQTIPHELYEAAEVDGASAWQRFWRITVPLLRPVIVVILVYRTMELFRVFDILYILMAYTIPVLAVKTYQESFVFGAFGRGAGLAFLVGILILIVAFVYIRLIATEED